MSFARNSVSIASRRRPRVLADVFFRRLRLLSPTALRILPQVELTCLDFHQYLHPKIIEGMATTAATTLSQVGRGELPSCGLDFLTKVIITRIPFLPVLIFYDPGKLSHLYVVF